MFTKSSDIYDLLYSSKNYQRESEVLIEKIKMRKPDAKTILDICCGTAEHHKYLKNEFKIDGIDLNEEFINIAKNKNPNCRYHIADMVDFELDKQYDILICLFSSIGYVKTFERLTSTLKCFNKHLKNGGLIIIEPWLTPENWYNGKIHMQIYERDDLKIYRMNRSESNGNLSVLHFHYLLGSSKRGVEHFEEKHELGLFTKDEIKKAFYGANLEVTFDEQGITKKGLYYGTKKSLPKGL